MQIACQCRAERKDAHVAALSSIEAGPPCLRRRQSVAEIIIAIHRLSEMKDWLRNRHHSVAPLPSIESAQAA